MLPYLRRFPSRLSTRGLQPQRGSEIRLADTDPDKTYRRVFRRLNETYQNNLLPSATLVIVKSSFKSRRGWRSYLWYRSIKKEKKQTRRELQSFKLIIMKAIPNQQPVFKKGLDVLFLERVLYFFYQPEVKAFIDHSNSTRENTHV